jgi:AraC-like DNA-binding protein
VQVDGSVTLEFNKEERQELSDALTRALWEKGETKVDSLPITKKAPYRFTFDGTEEEQETREKRWKNNIGLEKKQRDMTAEECLDWLYEKYEPPTDFNAAQKRTYISLCLSDDRNLMALTLAMKLTDFGEEIVDELRTTKEVFHLYFATVKGVDFKTWRTGLRIEEAKRLLLENRDVSTNIIGEVAGFSDRSNFHRQFVKIVGCSPKQWRESGGNHNH